MNPQDSSPSSSHLADVLGDLIKRIRDQHITLGSPIEAQEIKATNVVSGLQIIIHQPPSPTSSSLLWTITSRRNPYFTGREDLLTNIANSFQTSKGAATPQALSGMGGIGKTQIALEYAYRFVADYQFVFWAQAASRDTLIASYVTFATLLSLPEKGEQDQLKTVQAVKQWLTTHDKWLLILDNADELVIARDFLPASPTGHILLTTRAGVTAPLAQRIEVNLLPPDTAALFLLRRAGLLTPEQHLDQASSADQTLAHQLCIKLEGLALALDQAGAYILEEDLSLSSYLQKYEVSQSQLLNNRGGDLVDDHPDSVTKTLFLSFQLVQQRNPIAADLLRFCAFLAADAIPEELFTQDTAKLDSLLLLMKSDPQQFSTALKALRAYSLIRHNPNDQTLSIHRLVQVVLRDNMDIEAKQQWKQRAVLAINASFPNVDDVAQWDACERWLPHAQVCAVWIEQEQMKHSEAARLLNEAGYYLKQRARYGEAELLLRRGLSISEQQLGPPHPYTAASLNNLALLYKSQGRYSEAEPLFKRALMIRERQLGPRHPYTATSLDNLAGLYVSQGKYAEAEPLYQRALMIREQRLGPHHPSTATSLNSLAELYRRQGKYSEAESSFKRALMTREQRLGPQHPDTARSLTDLAGLYVSQDKYSEAEPLYQRALLIYEQRLGPQHPDTARSLNGLAELYQKQGKYSEAEPLYQRALHIRERAQGPQHPKTAETMHDLARLREVQGNSGEARTLYARALAVREQALGAYHPKTTETRQRFIALLHAMGQHEEAAQHEMVQAPP